jgi:ferredoxin
MPRVLFHKQGEVFSGEVAEQTNLVVRAGIRQFPYPHLTYGCGMGKCGKCACRVLAGAEHLPAPNWKETERLAGKIEDGYRLVCQLWVSHDIELAQDAPVAATAMKGA